METGISERVLERVRMIAERTKVLEPTAANIHKETRLELAMMVAATFREFTDFAELGMRYLGFTLSPMQRDIAWYMQHGPRKRMVQAQRGEAKSTLAALYAVWCLIQDQSYRVLIVSGGEDQASDVARLVILLIEQWHLLCWLRPDKARGDRTSYEAYDVHCDLKPIDKSASVSCVGVTANLQGKRADLLIPDDVETTKNSLTQTMRDQLLALTKDFSSINTHGETLYLGTPQTKDSIYKTLPSRGFDVRIWPGRYPTDEELQKYIPDTLAPMILEAIKQNPLLQIGGGIDGSRGQPADPVRYDEDALQEKELDWGPEGFALQYMLDTSLADAARTKIKLSDLIIGSWSSASAPEIIQYSAEPRLLYKSPYVQHLTGERMYWCASSSAEYIPYMHKIMVIDPAGDGGDEVAFAAGGAANGYVHVFTMGGLRGGVTEANMDTILDLMIEMEVYDLKVEKNMGHGTVESLFIQQIVKRKAKDPLHPDIGVEGYYSTGQKERRIIDTVSPLTRRHRLVVHERAIEDDAKYAAMHPLDKRTVFSGLYQLANITYDRGSLAKDDRADCVQGLVSHLSGMIALDDEAENKKREEAKEREFMNNPMGYEGGAQRITKGSRGLVNKWRKSGRPNY